MILDGLWDEHPDMANNPISAKTSIRWHEPLPVAVDIVVVGGGVAGVFAALYMRRAGFKVALLEKGRIACEQSSRNWGWIRQHGRDPDELPIMMEANRLWEEVDKDTKGRTGFARNGVCYLASSQETLDRRSKWLETAMAHQLDTRLLSKSEIEALIVQDGGNAHSWLGGTYTPSDARAEPWQAVPAIADLANHEGVILRENCAVRALEISAGKVCGVKTEDGTVHAEQVVVSAGAWSSLLLRRHGISIPQLSVKSTVGQTSPLPEVFSGNAADERLSFRRREDGGYTLAAVGRHVHYVGPDSFRHLFTYLPALKEHVHDTALHPWAPDGFPDQWLLKRQWVEDEVSPFEQTRVLEPKPDIRAVERMKTRFKQRFPAIGEPTILNCWAGMIDAMPDIVPIVDRVPGYEGLIVSTGFSGHGFGIGPGFGKIVANIAAGQTAGYDMSRFRFSRFTDGSKLRPGPAI